MIILVHSFSIMLHRVFDSAPAESQAAFYIGKQQYYPYEKPGGIYTFCDKGLNAAALEVTIQCPGYIDETISVKKQKLNHVFLYPCVNYQPPAGYQAKIGKAEPGGYIRQVENEKISLSNYGGANLLQLNSDMPFEGGGLALCHRSTQTVQYPFVIEKQPPNFYYLDMIPSDIEDCDIHRMFAAKANREGNYCLVCKNGGNSIERV